MTEKQRQTDRQMDRQTDSETEPTIDMSTRLAGLKTTPREPTSDATNLRSGKNSVQNLRANDIRPLRTATKNNVHVARNKLKFTDRVPSATQHRRTIWNGLPTSVRPISSSTLAHFKSSLRTVLYNRAFDYNWFVTALMILPIWLLRPVLTARQLR